VPLVGTQQPSQAATLSGQMAASGQVQMAASGQIHMSADTPALRAGQSVDIAAHPAYNRGVGIYDSVFSGERSGQVKCFGPCLTSYHLGSEVTLYRDPDQSWAPAGTVQTGVMPDRNYQIAMNDGSFLTVVDGRLKFWDDVRRDELSIYDNYGYEWDGTPEFGGWADAKHPSRAEPTQSD
jgi:hypothetical protein